MVMIDLHVKQTRDLDMDTSSWVMDQDLLLLRLRINDI